MMRGILICNNALLMSVRSDSTVPLARTIVGRVLPLISRIVAAVGGGYALAALFSVAVLALPANRIQAVIGGMLGSFAVYAAAVVWVFAVRSATRAWVGLLVVALLLLPFAWPVWTVASASASP